MSAAPEFGRPFAVERLGDGVTEQHAEASAAECVALARRMGIPAIAALSCHFALRRAEAGRIAAAGRVCAQLVRDCVVSLEPFEVTVDERFSVAFVPEGTVSDELDLDADDEIPYSGGVIDLGEAAAEQLALTLDPYPRKPGVVLPDSATLADESPFALLGRRRGEG
jgi:hypothetical protein